MKREDAILLITHVRRSRAVLAAAAAALDPDAPPRFRLLALDVIADHVAELGTLLGHLSREET